MEKIPVLLSLLVILNLGCKRNNEVLLGDLDFNNSIFSGSKKDSVHTYCLLATGYFRAPSSKNSDSLIKQWILKHPTAKVIPVASYGPTMSDYPDSKMTYCWLIDKGDTINNYLIRNGCYPGGTMTVSTIKELSEVQTLHIGKEDYEKFVKQIISAEAFARKQRLGIWNKKDNDDE